MLRAAIYARFSSDQQRDESIEDQVRVCRNLIEREGWTVVETYQDRAMSGATLLRPDYQAMMDDARAGKFDVLVTEALDRLSRDQENVAGLFKRLKHYDVGIVTRAEGVISEIHIGMKGTMNALFLKDLAQKTHRGLEGRVRDGKSGGGLSYGYKVHRRIDADGMPIAGDLQIVPEEAAILRRIFREYVSGRSPRAIAVGLNAEGVRSSRDGKWTASLILGNAVRETGILRNQLYVGERVWNRQRFVKDPETGRRVSRPNPRDVWVIKAVPNLRIIDEDTWAAAQVRLADGRQLVMDRRTTTAGPELPADGRETVGHRLAAARRPRWLLSGLVRCGLCDGPMAVQGSGGRLGCTNHRERGTCTNKRTVMATRIIERVMTGLKDRLLAPELVATFIKEYVAEVNAANRERGQRQAQLQNEHTKLGRRIRNLLDLMGEGHGSQAMVQELRALEKQQAD